jgi:type VII secretion protein EccB
VPSRQDQVHSHQFVVQRVVAAIVARETDPVPSPFRRAAGAALAGVLVAALGVAAAAVYGALRGGDPSGWRDANAVVIERESGAKYVYRDDRLHPVLNYASALLIVGSPNPNVVTVPRRILAGVARGGRYGIPGAPDALPDPARLLHPPWTVCSQRGESTLSLAEPDEAGSGLDDRVALLVAAPGGEPVMIWGGRRYRVLDREVVLAALGWSGQSAVPVSAAWLNVLPVGADLARVPIAGRGRPSSALKGAKVGQVFVVENQGGGRVYGVALPAGLAQITQVQADLLLSDPETASLVGQRDAIRLGPAELTVALRSSLVPGGETAPPETTPALRRPASGAALCAAFGPDGIARVRIPTVNRPGQAVETRGGPALADHVAVPPGAGAVIEVLASPGAPSGTLSLVTDLGVRYPVPSADVLAMLGYGGTAPVRVPAELAALLPAGPGLDPGAARAPVS